MCNPGEMCDDLSDALGSLLTALLEDLKPDMVKVGELTPDERTTHGELQAGAGDLIALLDQARAVRQNLDAKKQKFFEGLARRVGLDPDAPRIRLRIDAESYALLTPRAQALEAEIPFEAKPA